MSHKALDSNEARIIRSALNSDYQAINIRLREGEYQHSLAMHIGVFQLRLEFPDVKDLIKDLYGEQRANDIQFIRRIQTILKKMEKSGMVSILPKSRPWDLQRYALTSFKFHDVDKNSVILATDEQMEQSRLLLNSMGNAEAIPTRSLLPRLEIIILAFAIGASYLGSFWALLLPIINPVVFVGSFCVAIICSLFLGKVLSEE